MKEPILDYLQFSDPETLIRNLDKPENEPEVDMKKLVLDRKRTMQDWGSKVNKYIMDKIEKRAQ